MHRRSSCPDRAVEKEDEGPGTDGDDLFLQTVFHPQIDACHTRREIFNTPIHNGTALVCDWQTILWLDALGYDTFARLKCTKSVILVTLRRNLSNIGLYLVLDWVHFLVNDSETVWIAAPDEYFVSAEETTSIGLNKFVIRHHYSRFHIHLVRFAEVDHLKSNRPLIASSLAEAIRNISNDSHQCSRSRDPHRETNCCRAASPNSLTHCCTEEAPSQT